jgi:hypothetical protein
LRDVAPERVAPGFTGRFVFLEAAAGLWDQPGLEPGTLFRFTHRLNSLH